MTYNLYQQLGVDGFRGLGNFNVDSGKWGKAHSRVSLEGRWRRQFEAQLTVQQAHFAILKCLLRDGHGVVKITHDKEAQSAKVTVDRRKVVTHGKPALGNMLLRLHMYRCTADAKGCRAYYEDLLSVDAEHLEWREAVLASKPPPMVFVQGNTFLDGEKVVLKEYPATAEGVVQSWAERMV